MLIFNISQGCKSLTLLNVNLNFFFKTCKNSIFLFLNWNFLKIWTFLIVFKFGKVQILKKFELFWRQEIQTFKTVKKPLTWNMWNGAWQIRDTHSGFFHGFFHAFIWRFFIVLLRRKSSKDRESCVLKAPQSALKIYQVAFPTSHEWIFFVPKLEKARHTKYCIRNSA